MPGQTPDVENGPRPPIFSPYTTIDAMLLRKRARLQPPGGYTSYAATHDIPAAIHQNCRASVLHATEKEIKVNLASLQSIKILHLRQKLVDVAYNYRYAKGSIPSRDIGPAGVGTDGAVHGSSSDPSPVAQTESPLREREVPGDAVDVSDLSGYSEILREYIEAIRDWEFMKESLLLSPDKDPFVLTTHRQPDFDMIKSSHDAFVRRVNEHRRLHDSFIFSDYDCKPEFPRSVPEWNCLSVKTRGADAVSDFIRVRLQLFGMAFWGGAFLIVPMFIMVFAESRTAALVTTTVFVLAFGVILSLIHNKGSEVMSGTAAYAAVLVVFVGLTLERQAEQQVGSCGGN
ncbi:hypothetical protein QBC40DRAFT_325897 [Triangularia verruculosa]|uniref:DUF6594 domain-containing protein n=1 Tax=Triangularia verruculosa TaxID=2587418 RepID=A0AAN6XID4_9PEZI|nr:hypothetical protein QBC40DRAFT_325897 [Triangularia verruculosa]